MSTVSAVAIHLFLLFRQPGDKVAGAWSWPLLPSSAEVKEWVTLYLHSPIRLHGVVFS